MRNSMIVVVATAVLATALVFARAQQAPTAVTVEVFKTPTCGCCGVWVEHLRANGFTVVAHEVDQAELDGIAREAGLGTELRSCHTAKVGGYAVEGHVPAADIKRLLAERPEVAGIAVPGMPVGSPGMEMGDRRDPYNVVAFTRDGRRSVFAQYR